MEYNAISNEQQKSFCFADVKKNDYWDGKKNKEVSRQTAYYIDKIYHDIIMKNF